MPEIVTIDDPRIQAALKGGCHITYKEYHAIVPKSEVKQAMKVLKDLKTPADHIVSLLETSIEAFKKPNPTPKDFQTFMCDIAIWYANEILAGRASLESQ